MVMKAKVNEIDQYLHAIESTAVTGEATEFTFRTPLENLLVALAGSLESMDLAIVQEPTRKKGVGAPDFMVFQKSSGAVVGYVECKKRGEDLHALSRSKQVGKYKTLSSNILLTDYWNFYLLQEGEAKPMPLTSLSSASTAEDKRIARELFLRFLGVEPQKIGDAKTLAQALAERCRALQAPLVESLETDKGKLQGIFKSFQETIYRNLDKADFADALAQTLVFGLLTAKLNLRGNGLLELDTAKRYIPRNYELLCEITGFLDELGGPHYANIWYLICDILAIVNAMDATAITDSLSYQGKRKTNDDDPYCNFYEDFLAAYDAELREARGVYYTPLPVVRFIVGATDKILRKDFNVSNGLADRRVTALDFAAGTGTFMLEMYKLVLSGKDIAQKDALAHGHLLRNFSGFELLLAPFIISHLKLSQFLRGEGIDLQDNTRMRVILANTLENDDKRKTPELSFMPALAKEYEYAQGVKGSEILVVVGNPPYSGASLNKGKWITDLVAHYKYVDGKHFKEKKHLLDDDYVKFIRYAQHKVDNQSEGIVAIVTNHAFLDNITFRGMRQSLMKTFDQMYFLDLLGNSKRYETMPEGEKDENVFAIQQGVSISVLIKKKGLESGVFHYKINGRREEKYKWLDKEDFKSVAWERVNPKSPYYFFIPRDDAGYDSYQKHWGITKIFDERRSGVETSRDKFTLGFDKEKFYEKIKRFVGMPPEEARQVLELGPDVRNWKVHLAQADLRKSGLDERGVRPIAYRPFDIRWTYYTGNSNGFHGWPRDKVMRHMLAGDNVGLVTVRQAGSSGSWRHCLVTNTIVERCFVSNRGKEAGYLCPLYRHDEEVGKDKAVRRENFNPDFRSWVDEHHDTPSPESVFGYIYATLHSPDYRNRYAEFLRIDFPRIPFPEDNDEFLRLSSIGRDLIDAHLLYREFSEGAELRGGSTTHIVESIRYVEGDERLYLNADEYFSPIPLEVYNFQIGGYHPLDKFLKSRKGRSLSSDEVRRLEQVARAIDFTLRKQKEIDAKGTFAE